MGFDYYDCSKCGRKSVKEMKNDESQFDVQTIETKLSALEYYYDFRKRFCYEVMKREQSKKKEG